VPGCRVQGVSDGWVLDKRKVAGHACETHKTRVCLTHRVRRETERIQAELAERELEEARQMLEAAKKKGGAKGLKIKDGAPLNKQARGPGPLHSSCFRCGLQCFASFCRPNKNRRVPDPISRICLFLSERLSPHLERLVVGLRMPSLISRVLWKGCVLETTAYVTAVLEWSCVGAAAWASHQLSVVVTPVFCML